MYDVVIRGGTIVDGSGAPRAAGDLAIQDGRIAALGRVKEKGHDEIDARGLAVAPGFVDVHTHYDAQLTWDPYATCSIWHGVTTVVIGNCGFGIAPCRPEHRDLIMRTLERVEGMSIKAMRAGIDWGFETFPEYLDHLERLRPGVNVAALLGHSAIRLYVMGEESMAREASEGELEAMLRITREAMTAGAIGLGSTTTEAHNGADGRPVPSRLASWPEFQALTRAMGESGKGLFEITIGGRPSLNELRALHQACRRPVVWAAFFDRPDKPEETAERLAETEAFARDGVEVRPQVACRPLIMDFTLANPYPFEGIPAWKRVLGRPVSEYARVYADPEFRAALKDDLAHRRTAAFRGDWEQVRVLKAARPEHRAWEGQSIPDLARARGWDPIDTFLDLALAENLETEFLAGLMNTDEERVARLISHPETVLALSDAGAHQSLLCDAGYSSTLLGKWVRERGTFTLEEAVRRLTSWPAQVYRIPERGLLRPGYWADVVLFDPETIQARDPERAYDLPAGEMRFVSRAKGIVRVLVNGKTVLEEGRVIEAEAEERSGRVLREFLA
jgi:N-acyl-D-aspartate/D-glutamate deacylase